MDDSKPRSYRFQQATIDKMEEVREHIEKDLGTKISATSALEILITKYHKEYIQK